MPCLPHCTHSFLNYLYWCVGIVFGHRTLHDKASQHGQGRQSNRLADCKVHSGPLLDSREREREREREKGWNQLDG